MRYPDGRLRIAGDRISDGTTAGFPRDIIGAPSFPMNHKRVEGLLAKWYRRGLYDFGTVIDMGWVTAAGAVCDDPRHPPAQLEVAASGR